MALPLQLYANSPSISGYVNQCPIQVEILRSLSQLIRSGQYTGEIGVPDALVLVGHSLGSALSAAAVAAEPDLAEGLVLTGEETLLCKSRTNTEDLYRIQL